MRPTDIAFRPMQAADLPAILAVQRLCYPAEMNEDATTWRQRLASAAAFSWVAEDVTGVCAYLACYPSRLGKVTSLGDDFLIAETADCLYLHDLAVAPAATGRGLGGALVRQALQAARGLGLAHAALVCVQDAFSFWQAQGFADHPGLSPAGATALASYPGPARYMSRPAG